MTTKKEVLGEGRSKYVVWTFSSIKNRVKISTYKKNDRFNVRISLELGKRKWLDS